MSNPMLTAPAPTPLLEAATPEPLSDEDFSDKYFSAVINGEERDPEEIIRIIAESTHQSIETIREMQIRLIVKKEM